MLSVERLRAPTNSAHREAKITRKNKITTFGILKKEKEESEKEKEREKEREREREREREKSRYNIFYYCDYTVFKSKLIKTIDLCWNLEFI